MHLVLAYNPLKRLIYYPVGEKRVILFGNTRCFLYNYHPLSGFLRVVVDNGVTEV